MSDALTALLLGAAVSVAVATLTMTATALVGRAQGRVVVVDTAWGLGFAAIAVTAALVSLTGAGDGEPWRTWLLAAMVAIWGLRLARHLHVRNHTGEDPRYEKHMGGTLAEVGLGVAIRKVFGVQGAAMALVAWPAAAAAFAPLELTWVFAVGVVLWAVGLLFEAVGDAQLAAYKATPRGERPLVMETGLWRYTRHPNYFGDSCLWWGIWLAGGVASGWVIGLVTVLGPIAMTFFLVKATGAGLLEQTMMQRPGYPEYAARTSKFIPLPPRRAGQRVPR
ncbi:DUF1295 domain-containing protein [Nocardioides sp. YIM 152588]|uniref:DUF1295 domain-containing protein n=1 Tax=Nocardioides sp. YIM 152588 TaxID=3158259 RepID=UPI0032E381C2